MNAFAAIMNCSTMSRVALHAAEGSFTYEDLARKINQIGNRLLEIGVVRSENVMLVAENSLMWVASYLALLKIGAVAVPVSAGIQPGTLSRLIPWLDARVIIMSERALVRCGLFIPSGLIVLSDCDARVRMSAHTIVHDLYAADSDCGLTEVSGDDLAALMLTSNSTGAPRAVKISHRNLISNTTSINAALKIEPQERVLCVLPFAYCFGASLLHTHLAVGGSLALFSGAFSPRAITDAFVATGATSLAGVPSLFHSLLRRGMPPGVRWPKIRRIQQAGGHLAVSLVAELQRALPEADIFIMYGQTEATARLTCLQPQYLNEKPGSVGRAIPGVNVKIMTPEGKSAKPGEAGEIVAQGDNIASGYWKDTESTNKTFKNGCLHTGDWGYCDSEGFIYIVDRINDFIKTSGYRCSSLEIEERILALPGVAEVAVIGVPDHIRGETVRAYVVSSVDSASLSEQTIIRHCRTGLPSYMVPREVIFLSELPKTEHGKISKAALKQRK